MLAKEYTPMLTVHHATSDFGAANGRYRNAYQEDGLRIIVIANGMMQLDTLFVCTMCVGVRMYSVFFVSIRDSEEKTTASSWSEQPVRLSPGETTLPRSLELSPPKD
jgi:hypothetical protein